MFDAVGDVEAAVAKLRAFEGPVDVVRLARLRNQLEALWLRAIGEYERSEAWVAEGFATAASALRVKCGTAQGTASASLRLAEKLRELPVAFEAFSDGDVSRTHVSVLADACTPARAPAIGELEPVLVDAARIADPREFARIVRRVTDALDGDDGARGANARHARRRCHLSRTLDGMVVGDFLLDAEDGETVIRAIDAMRGRYSRSEVRTPAQQRADALVELCRVGAARAEAGPGSVHADVVVHVDLAEIEARGGAELARAVKAGAGKLPKATLRRLACDARIARVITAGPSQVLDVGRATRTVPASLRRALEARDRGCSWRGCDRPVEWCHSHHVRHWVDGGPTKIDNLRLLCRHHHRLVHEGGHDPP
jgi:hypothetical protein